MAVNPRVSMLLDIYGSMLTEKERDALELYYNEDLSLSEIADNEFAERRAKKSNAPDDAGDYSADTGKTTISRQGVRDAIKRAENKLFEMERKLALAEKLERLREELDSITEKTRMLREYNSRYGRYPEIERLAAEIIEIAERISE